MKFDVEYARSVISAEAAAISQMADVIDDSFVAALEMICNVTGSVIVTGMGKAGIIGQKISATLASTGTPSHFLHPAEAVHGDLGRIGPNDVVIALSHSGESEEIVRLINPIKQQQVKLIAVTADSNSRLGRHSDVTISMGKLTEVCPFGMAPSVSTTCMLAIGDAIALTVMKARDFSVEDYAKFHPGGALGAKLIMVGQSMMFKAGEKLPAVKIGQTIGQMCDELKDLTRRGAVMIVDGNGKLAGIITDADLRREMSEKGSGVFECKTEDVMTPDCKRVTENTLAAEAMAIFHKYRIDELPVVDEDDRPVGMIDVQDIVAIKIVG